MTLHKIILSCFLLVITACNGPTHSKSQHEARWSSELKDQIGSSYEIRWTQNTQNSGDTGSSGSANSRMTLIERVIDVNDDGLVLEFDLPAETTDDERKRSWQFPARVRKAHDNSLTLLNTAELKSRNGDWLKLGNFDQSHCGLWIFTWVAQKIECNPNSILTELEGLDIRRVQLMDGTMYESVFGLSPVPLQSLSMDTGGVRLEAELEVDPEIVRLQRAESDIVVAQILGEEIPTLDEAVKSKEMEKISGTIRVTYELDENGQPVCRIRKTDVEVLFPDGSHEKIVTTDTVERELLSPSTR